MAFNTAPGRAEYTASAAQTIFTFTFKIFETSNVKAYLTPANQAYNDATDILIETTDYTVSINGDNGGDVTLTSGATLNDRITLVRSLPADRDAEYQQNGDLTAEALNEDQDYQTYLILDGVLIKERALIFQDSVQNVSSELPSPEPTKILGWNALGSALDNYTVGTDDVFINILNVDNVTDLIAVSTLTHATVNVRGYYSPNDEGGGIFNYDSTQSAVNNGGTVINGWVRQYDGAINVKWFGAKGDGTTDDTTAIQNAIDATPDGGTLDFASDDTYSISQTTVDDNSITMNGNGCTMLQSSDTEMIIADSDFLNITTPTSVGTSTITISNTSDLFLYVEANIDNAPVLKIVSDDATFLTDVIAGEFVKVISVNSSTGEMTLAKDLKFTYSTSIRVGALSTKKFILKNMEFDTKDITFNSRMLLILPKLEPEFINLKCNKNGTGFIKINSCYNYKITNIVANSLTDDIGNLRFGYGIEDDQCFGGLVEGGIFNRNRHGYTTGRGNAAVASDLRHYGVAEGAIVSNCFAYSCTAASFDTHPGADNITFDGCTSDNSSISGFQMRGGTMNMVGCVSVEDLAFLVGSNQKTNVIGCIAKDTFGELFSIREDAECVVEGGAYEQLTGAGSRLRQNTILTISNANIKTTSNSNTSMFRLESTGSTLTIRNSLLELIGVHNDARVFDALVDSDITSSMIGSNNEIRTAQSTGTNVAIMRNDTACVFIMDDTLLDSLPVGGFLRFGAGYGTYGTGSGYDYRTHVSRTAVVQAL